MVFAAPYHVKSETMHVSTTRGVVLAERYKDIIQTMIKDASRPETKKFWQAVEDGLPNTVWCEIVDIFPLSDFRIKKGRQ